MDKESLKIKTSKVIWKGFGTSLSWFANGINASNEFKDYLSELLFNQNNKGGLQLNIVRYNIGSSTIQDIQTMRPGGAVPKWDVLNLDEKIDQNQIDLLRGAKSNGVKIFEAFSNSPLSEMTRSGSVAGSKSWKDAINKYFPKANVPNFTLTTNLKRDKSSEFAEYIVKVTQYLIEKEGIPFKTISPINEPSGPGWVVGNNQEGCFYGYPNRTNVFSKLSKSIKKNKVDLQISGCEENNLFQALCGIVFNPFVWMYINQYNVHRYRIGGALGFNTKNFEDSNCIRSVLNFIINKCFRKNIWVSEFGMGYDNGVTNYHDVQNVFNLANYIMDDLIYLKPEAWIYWQVIELNSGNGWGLMQLPFDNPNKNDITFGAQYKSFQHFSHFIKPGDQMLILSKPKNSKVKWVGSYNQTTKKTNIIILSTNEVDISLELPNVNNLTKCNMMVTTGDSSECKTLICELNMDKVCIKAKSLTSLTY